MRSITILLTTCVTYHFVYPYPSHIIHHIPCPQILSLSKHSSIITSMPFILIPFTSSITYHAIYPYLSHIIYHTLQYVAYPNLSQIIHRVSCPLSLSFSHNSSHTMPSIPILLPTFIPNFVVYPYLSQILYHILCPISLSLSFSHHSPNTMSSFLILLKIFITYHVIYN